MSNELSRAGWVWRTKHLETVRQWMTTGGQNAQQLAVAAEHLRTYLERAPDRAEDIARLAMNVCLTSQRRISPEDLWPYVRIASEAKLLKPECASKYVVALLCYAQALLAYDRRIDGLEALRKCQGALEQLVEQGPILQWTRAKVAHLSGGLWQLDLERARAFESFQEALDATRPLLKDTDDFARAWVESYFSWMGEGVRVEDFGPLATMELERLYTDCAIGVACNVDPDASSELRIEAARAACNAIEHFGPSPDTSPLSLSDILAPLDPDEAQALADHLLGIIESNENEAGTRDVPAGLTYGPAVEIAQRALRSAHDRMQQYSKVWGIAAQLGVARATHLHGDDADARTLFVEAIQKAMENRQGLPQAVAAGRYLEFEATQPEVDLDSLIKVFIIAFAATASVEPGTFDQPMIRAMVDGAITVVARRAMEWLADEDNAAIRERSSLLIDLMRRPESPPPAPLLASLGLSGSDAGPSNADEANLIDRIVNRLGEISSSAVLVIQSLQDGVAFLSITKDGPQHYGYSGSEYLGAIERLDAAVQVPLFAALAGMSTRYATQTQQAGVDLFNVLPPEIQAVVREHKTLLLVPDFRGPHPVQPFELLHDGREFLGLSKIIARFASLAHLAGVLESEPVPARHSRALITSAPRVDGYPPLPLAGSECQSVSNVLDSRGYDAPPIRSADLSAKFYRERLPVIDVLHIAAHGEARADSEWLVLPGGERLVVDDLLSVQASSLPFAYLSTCNLARTRYLGAGISRGLAYTLADQGAPAVVSNTTPVLDQGTSALATKFYDMAMEYPVGEALRMARAKSEVSAATWGRAVLFGNPWHSLPLSDSTRGLARPI